ncbi:hypothetical protein [Methanobrevibacter sp.]
MVQSIIKSIDWNILPHICSFMNARTGSRSGLSWNGHITGRGIISAELLKQLMQSGQAFFKKFK